MAIQNNLMILDSAHKFRLPAIKVQSNLFSFLEILKAQKIRHGISLGLIFGPGIFLGFVGRPRDFFNRHIKFCKQNTAMLIVLREN